MSEATTPMERPTFGPQGEPCANCGSRLARDQRYCLDCGTRRAGMGALLSDLRDPRHPAAPRPVEPAVIDAAPPTEGPWRLDAGLLAGVGCLLLALLVGVLIGRSGAGGDNNRRAAAPQVVTVGGTAAGGATNGAPTAFSSDWPAGKRGFTVQLQTLPADGTDAAAVAAAKQAAAAKGAPAVGALDSDGFGTLDAGRYVIFSGQFADRKAAKAALAKLDKRFPGAKVVEVAEQAQRASISGGPGKAGTSATGKATAPSKAEQAAGAKAIQDIQSATGKDYSKRSAKLPKTLVTPGKLPPKDKKAAGGGSGAQTFK